MKALKRALCVILLGTLVPVAFCQNHRGAEVPAELAKRAAVHYAGQFYGKSSVWDCTPYYGLDGEIEVYAVVLYRGPGEPPTPAELAVSLAGLRGEIDRIEHAITVVPDQRVSGKRKATELTRLRERLVEKRREYLHTDTFITVLAGAHEGHVPVIRVYRALPEHLTRAPYARRAAREAGVNVGSELVRAYYIGLFDIAFEFGSKTVLLEEPPADDTTVVLAGPGTVVSVGQLREAAKVHEHRQRDQRAVDSEVEKRRLERLRDKWARVKALSGGSERLKEREKPAVLEPNGASMGDGDKAPGDA